MTTRGPSLKKLKAAVEDTKAKEIRAYKKFDKVHSAYKCASRLYIYKLKRFVKAMDKCGDVSAHGPFKVQLRESKWQGEENAFRDFIIDLKDISLSLIHISEPTRR